VPADAAPGTDGRVRLVYSGSTAGWQSFGMLRDLLDGWLTARPELHVLFLSARTPGIEALMAAHPGRVEARWLDHARVGAAIAACDYGIMVRERTITNRVASPTKFAEYLASGLRVITNEGLGDLSAAVEQHDLGVIVRGAEPPVLPPVTPAQRARARAHARAHFTKPAYAAEYGRLKQVLAGG
ncbi:MAG: hypothetical protein RBT71_11965, partial [Flavobacteriales bacterium]|jgi:hypothetical protein|nr:hypothetical protein [Flavobacteriales bacterium]